MKSFRHRRRPHRDLHRPAVQHRYVKSVNCCCVSRFSSPMHESLPPPDVTSLRTVSYRSAPSLFLQRAIVNISVALEICIFKGDDQTTWDMGISPSFTESRRCQRIALGTRTSQGSSIKCALLYVTSGRRSKTLSRHVIIATLTLYPAFVSPASVLQPFRPCFRKKSLYFPIGSFFQRFRLSAHSRAAEDSAVPLMESPEAASDSMCT